MPFFAKISDAVAYRSEQQDRGLECRLRAVLEGFIVECTFVVSVPPPAQPPVQPPVQQLPATMPVEKIPLIPHGEISIPNIPPMYPYQMEAAEGAIKNKHYLIVLPTGEGKTNVALYIINALKIPTIIVVPTLQLVSQWIERIKSYGGYATGVSGERVEFSPITVITYPSALRRLDEVVNYKMIIFDEAHHLFAPEYVKIADAVIAHGNIRIIGLTASPREFGAGIALQDRIFPERYIRTIADRQQSERRVEVNIRAIPIPFDEIQQEEYDIAWKKYRDALSYFGNDFVRMTKATQSQDPESRTVAFSGIKNYNRVKQLLSGMPQKIDKAAEIINASSGQFIIFGDTVAMVDTIYDRLTVDGVKAVRIHYNLRQRAAERDRIVNMMRTGQMRVLIGAVAISEGLDLPDLDNAIFVSIIQRTTRTYIQRLGRIMRSRPGKVATLWVLYVPGTVEERNLGNIKDLLGD